MVTIPGLDSPSLDQALTRDISSNDKLTTKEKKKFRVGIGASFLKDVWNDICERYKRNPLVKRHRAEKFRIAAINGDLELIRTAVEDWDVNVNDKNKEGQTAVYCAAREGRFKVVNVLCADEGADVNLLTETNGRSALWWACFNGDLPIVECLVQHGANVNQQDQDGRSPLWTAANHNHIPIVKYLLKHGGDLNQGDNDGETPLWFAAYTGRHKTVTALLKEGADMEKRSNSGTKPRDIALNFQSKQALDKEESRQLSKKRAKKIFQKELEIAFNQSLKRSQSKLLQSSSIRSSSSRQRSRLARNTWAGTMDHDNDDNDDNDDNNDDNDNDNDDDDDDDDDYTNYPFNTSFRSFSPGSPSSIQLSFSTPRTTPRSASPSGTLVANKPSYVKFNSLKISERDENLEHDVVPFFQPDNTPFHTPSFTPMHTPSLSNFHTPIQSFANSPFISPAISRASSNAHLDHFGSPPSSLLLTNSNPTISTTTTSVLPLSPSSTPDETIQKSLYKIELTRAQKQDDTQVLLQRVHSSRALLKQELDTSKEVLENLNRKKEEIARLLRQQSRHMRDTV